MPSSSKTKRRLVIVLGGLAGIVVLVLGGTWVYINLVSDDAPDPFSLSDEPAGEAPGDAVTLDGTWTVATGSEAGYRVDEVLNGLDNTVVGRTDEVSGDITIADGAATAAEIVVDMGTVTTDSSARDGQFQGPIMDTDNYPTSTFTLTEPIPLDELPGSDSPITLTAQGELTIRDVTRPVEAEFQVQLSGEDAQVAGSIPIRFTDFEIDPPNLAFVRVEEEGLVEFLLTFTRS